MGCFLLWATMVLVVVGVLREPGPPQSYHDCSVLFSLISSFKLLFTSGCPAAIKKIIPFSIFLTGYATNPYADINLFLTIIKKCHF